MGRLFWKVFFAFWLTMLCMALVAVLAVNSVQVSETEDDQSDAPGNGLLATSWRANERLRQYDALLRYGGVAALKAVLQNDAEEADRRDGRRQSANVMAVNEAGDELLGRMVPAATLAAAREQTQASLPAGRGGHRVAVRLSADTRGNAWWLFVPGDVQDRRTDRQRPLLRRLPGWAAPVAGLVFSLLFSGVLAWYLARPIRVLRDGMRQVAEGDLATRVAPHMGARRDELADLGRDFDRTTERLAQLIDSQRRLLHDVSHELRSPLARLQAAIGLMEQSPQRGAEMTSRIERESQRLDQLVDEILTLSRLEDSASRSAPASIDLRALLEDLLEDARFEGASRKQQIHLSGATRAMVTGDAALLHRAIENVVRNAMKFAPDGSDIDVDLSTQVASIPSGSWVTVTVADRGPGLADDQLTKVLDPFVRALPADGPAATTGFGLGLTIAQRAMTLHGGSLRLSNRAGGGLIAHLMLPAE